MSKFGTGGIFLCYAISMLFLAMAFGWPALMTLILATVAISAVMDSLNDRYFPDGKLRPRGVRIRRRR
jgi:hypothetical protein